MKVITSGNKKLIVTTISYLKRAFFFNARDLDKEQKAEKLKEDLRANKPKMGIFLNSASPTIAEQISNSGYDWLLVDTQHGPMETRTLTRMITAISNGNALSMVRVAGYHDRKGIQEAFDNGSNGVLIPYINTPQEAKKAIGCCYFPPIGTRSMYMTDSNKNQIVAIQIETASCIKNIESIVATPGLDVAFLGQNDLCMSMGLFEIYKFPDMYFSKELNEATEKIIAACKKNKVIPGIFLFGTDRVEEFLDKGFRFISIGNDLHHALTQTGTHVKKLEEISKSKNRAWVRNPTSLL